MQVISNLDKTAKFPGLWYMVCIINIAVINIKLVFMLFLMKRNKEKKQIFLTGCKNVVFSNLLYFLVYHYRLIK